MEHHGILDWLLSDAGAGWAFGFITCAALVVNWIAGRRGDKLICKELLKSHVMSSGGRIGVTYDGNPVKALALAKFEVYNSARSAIKPITLRLVFPETSKVLDARCQISPASSELQASIEFSGNEVHLDLPYLNPFKAHKQRVSISVILDGEFDKVEMVGGGAGWSVAKEHIPGPGELRRRAGVMFAAVIAGLALTYFIYRPFLEKRFGISDEEVSLRAFASFTPLILAFVGWVWILFRWVLRPQVMRDISRLRM